MVLVVARTRNSSIMTTTLHMMMDLHVKCMVSRKNFVYEFIEEGPEDIFKYLKAGSEEGLVIYLDYGVSCSTENLLTGDHKVLVVPCVLPEIDWELFRKKTLENSSEPIHQRALSFDIKVDSKGQYLSGTGRIIVFEPKATLKKLRDSDSKNTGLPFLNKKGLKISVLSSTGPLCHYTYECKGNLLNAAGTTMSA